LRASRAFGILSAVFLLVAALTGLLPIASIVNLRVSVGQIEVSGTTASVPLTLQNGGFLALNGFKITANLLDSSGNIIGAGSSGVIDIPPGGTTPLMISITSNGGNLGSASKVQIMAATNIGGFLPVTTLLTAGTHFGGGTAPLAQTAVSHVVIIMMENHAFDNIFGVYPTANGTISGPLVSNMQIPENLLGRTGPTGIAALPAGTFSTPDMPHDSQSEIAAYDNGANDGFAANMGSDSLRYFTNNQLAGEWNLAEQYGLSDSYFQSVLGPTIPNRLTAITGTVPDPSYANAENISDSAVASFAQKSLFAELTAQGLSWGYYSEGSAGVLASLAGNAQLPFPPGSLGSVSDFLNRIANGTMPGVSWLDPFS